MMREYRLERVEVMFVPFTIYPSLQTGVVSVMAEGVPEPISLAIEVRHDKSVNLTHALSFDRFEVPPPLRDPAFRRQVMAEVVRQVGGKS